MDYVLCCGRSAEGKKCKQESQEKNVEVQIGDDGSLNWEHGGKEVDLVIICRERRQNFRRNKWRNESTLILMTKLGV